MRNLCICSKCLQAFNLVLATTSESQLVNSIRNPDGSPLCPRLCGGVLNTDPSDELLSELGVLRLSEAMNLTGEQYFKAVGGIGLPDEVPKDLDVIESLLKANRVEAVKLEQWNDRIYLHELTLSNGMTIHLAAGGKGAQVFKITRST